MFQLAIITFQVCNHPELFERMDLKSPCFVQFEPYYLPKLVYREGMLITGAATLMLIVLVCLLIYSLRVVNVIIINGQSANG